MHAVAEKTMHNRMDSILGGCCINGFYGYGGQVGVGRAVKASGVPCEEIHIISMSMEELLNLDEVV